MTENGKVSTSALEKGRKGGKVNERERGGGERERESVCVCVCV